RLMAPEGVSPQIQIIGQCSWKSFLATCLAGRLVIGNRQERRTLRAIGRYRVIDDHQGETGRTQILHNPPLKIYQAAVLCLDHQRSDVDRYEPANIRVCPISNDQRRGQGWQGGTVEIGADQCGRLKRYELDANRNATVAWYHVVDEYL